MKKLFCGLAFTLASATVPVAAESVSPPDAVLVEYAQRLAERVHSHWVMPRKLKAGDVCFIKLDVTPDGSPRNVDYTQCQGVMLKSSAESALKTAQPLPVPPAAIDPEKLRGLVIRLRR